ncbi:MAG: carbohydrate-binding domain-containing protein [Eubacteriales bacterium]|nr:carbohydrate-binding domain-containing protein [Eubacteriales bacterium]
MKILSLILCAALLLSGCASGSEAAVATVTVGETAPTVVSVEETAQAEETDVFSDRDLNASYSESGSIAITLNGSSISSDSSSVAVSGTTATIQKAGTYLLSGTLENGSIVVDAEKADKIQLILGGVSIYSEASAAIYVRQADKVFVTLADGTQNSLSNSGTFEADGDTNIDAVIFSKDDLTLNGNGTLSITSPGGHGIVSKDSLRLTGGTYTIDAASHGLSGKDEISIAAGSFTIAAGKDGIHAENSDDADAGTVYLENGTYRITAEGDGISASGSCRIVDGDYAITAGGGSENAQHSSSNQGFAGGQRGGNRPDDAMQQNGQSFPEWGGDKKGGMGGGKGMDRMNPAKEPANGQDFAPPAEETETVSAKGIKAGSLTIAGGSFTIDSADDGLHANGDLTLWGGTLEIASGDDGIHADETVTTVSGTVSITESYEGIEGQHVEIQGGEITLTATDDGLNAAGGRDGSGFGMRGDSFTQSGDTSSIVISGGTVYVTASGDGIDANGTLEITGGTVTVSGPTYGDTSVLDYDQSGTISGGTFIGTGGSSMAQTFSGGTQGVISVKVGTQSGGTEITLTDSSGTVLFSCTPALGYEIVIFSSPEIQSGGSYTLNVGGSAQTVTAK